METITLCDYKHTWKLNVSKDIIKTSQYLNELVGLNSGNDSDDSDETEMCEVMEGDTTTSEMTHQAIQKLQLLETLDKLVQQFNYPPSETSVQTLQEWKSEIINVFNKWNSLPDSPIYKWLFPNQMMVMNVCDEDSPAGWYRTHDLPSSFRDAFKNECYRGNEQIMKWIYHLEVEDHEILFSSSYAPKKNEYLQLFEFFVICCQRGFESIARWLYDIQNTKPQFVIDIHKYDEQTFRMACMYGNISIAKWLIDESIRIGSPIDIHIKKDYAFRGACMNGHLDVAKWLYSQGGVDIHAGNDYAFVVSCRENHESVARWLVSLGGVNPNSWVENDNIYNTAFSYAMKNRNTEFANWICTIDGYKINKDITGL